MDLPGEVWKPEGSALGYPRDSRQHREAPSSHRADRERLRRRLRQVSTENDSDDGATCAARIAFTYGQEFSTAVVDLIEELLCGGARLVVFGQVVWIGSHGEDLFEFSAGVVVASHFLVCLGQVQMKKCVWFAEA